MKKNISKYKLLLIFTIIFFSCLNTLHAQETVTNGILDISKTDFSDKSIIKLDGQWEFYYNKILSYSDFQNSNPKAQYYNVPALWNIEQLEGVKISPQAVATYRLKIKTSEKTKFLSIKAMKIFSAYKIFINDSLIIEVGTLQTEKTKEKPAIKTVTSSFIVPDTSFYLIIQVSNFNHKKGGIKSSLEIGSPESIYMKSRNAKNLELFVLGLMIIMAFYNIGLFILWKKNTSALYFGLLLISVFLHMVTNEEVLITYYTDFFSAEFIYKIDFITNYTTALFFGLFFFASEPKYYIKSVKKILVIATIILSGIVIFTKTKFYSETLILFEIIVILLIPYTLVGQIRAVIKKEIISLQELIGTLILFATAINDILYENSIIATGYFLWLGLTIFTMVQSLSIARRYTFLFNKTDNLNSLISEIDSVKNQLIKESGSSVQKVLEIISNKNQSTRALLFVNQNNKPVLKSSYFKFHHNKENTDQYPNKIIENCFEEKKPLNLANAYQTKEFFDKEYLDTFKPKSVLCIPLISNDEIPAIIYFENEMQTGVFSDNSIEIITILSSQIINIIDNIDKYNEIEFLNSKLEEIIEERTSEVMQQREELQTQKEEIQRQNEYLNSVYDEISIQNKEINDSINYAKRMQTALLPNDRQMTEIFPESMIFFRPKDVLSGDFYWVHEQNNIKIFAVVDCTGHGVPGALMSIIGNNMLYNQTISNKKVDPAKILDGMQDEISIKLKQNVFSESKDGMDLSIIAYNKENSLLTFAGARNTGILIRDNEIIEIKANRMSIGGAEHARIKSDSHFTNQEINIMPGDSIYLFSDGYIDQLGGKGSRKFMKKRFYELLKAINSYDTKIQEKALSEALSLWKGQNIQIDDILVAGIKF